MDASAVLKMVEDALYVGFLIIYVTVSGDYITMQSVIKHPYKGAQGQVINLSNRKLDREIPEPYLLVDPSYCVKVVSKHICSIVK